MIKVMIVDDEMWVRTSLKNKIPWSDTLVLCGEATNSFEALELAKTQKPDIVVTDVRMPGMNGLDLIGELHKFLPKLQSIIISGYDDFSYVKQAIKLDACDYVLKPIRKNELNTAIDKAITQIHKETILCNTTQTELELLHTFLLSLYHNKPVPKERFLSINTHLNLSDMYAWVLLLRFLDTQEDFDIIANSLDKIAPSYPFPHNYQIFAISDTLWGIYLTSEQKIDMLQYSRSLIKRLQTNESIDISIAFGMPASSFEELPMAFHTAREALGLMHPYNMHEIVLPAVSKSEHPLISPPSETVQEIIDGLYAYSPETLEKGLSNLHAFICTTPNLTLYDSNRMLFFLLGDIMRILYERNSPKKLSDQGIAFMKELSEYSPEKDYLEQFFQYCRQVLAATRTETSTVSSVRDAEQYIRNNYQKDLSLKKVADLFYLNASYFSVSFKNITGKTFSEYLTTVRMEQAKLLLQDKKIKINQVAHMIGYEDSGYFGKSFRKYTGLTPSEYQNNTKGHNN